MALVIIHVDPWREGNGLIRIQIYISNAKISRCIV